jgi:hypothetical protein
MPTPKRLLIQVVPQLKPARCGVSDHALLLAQELACGFGVETAFVVLNSADTSNSAFPKVYCEPSRLVEACVSLSKGQAGSVLLHYSGYGYSADGAPVAVAEALRRLRNSGQFRIGAYFHELSASGMPWTSAFWHTHLQRKVGRRIAGECDLIATNLDRHADWLERDDHHGIVGPVHRLPVFSNVGESVKLSPMRARRRIMAVFGLPGTRRNSYKRLLHLGKMLNELGVEEIMDIGPECNAPANLGAIPVRRLGVMAAKDIAGLLAQSMCGFVPHPSFCLAKSGIFAGLCAHGAVPVLADHFSEEVDELRDGVHLVSERTAKAALDAGLERCSAAAWNWYKGHRLRIHAETYSRLLVQTSVGLEAAICAAVRESGVKVRHAFS